MSLQWWIHVVLQPQTRGVCVTETWVSFLLNLGDCPWKLGEVVLLFLYNSLFHPEPGRDPGESHLTLTGSQLRALLHSSLKCPLSVLPWSFIASLNCIFVVPWDMRSPPGLPPWGLVAMLGDLRGPARSLCSYSPLPHRSASPWRDSTTPKVFLLTAPHGMLSPPCHPQEQLAWCQFGAQASSRCEDIRL